MGFPRGTSTVVRFGSFQANLNAGELRRNGTKVRLQEQPLQILAVFLERPGEVVTREELQRKLWPADTFVDFDNGLNIAVKKLRTALGDDAEAPRYIETIPRRGYRFIAAVSADVPESSAPHPRDKAPLFVMPNQEEPAMPEAGPEAQNAPTLSLTPWNEAASSNSSTALVAPETVLVTSVPSGQRWPWLLAAAAVGALTAALWSWWSRPPAIPVVVAVEQLTDDGEPKQGRLVSDGSRVYFNEGPTGSWKIAEVSVAGGRSAPVDTRLINPQIAGLVADGSALVAMVGGFTDAVYPVWSIPLPAGEPRRLGSLQILAAGVLPDGSIAFSAGTDLYIADKDGSNPRKLVSVAGAISDPSVSADGRRLVLKMAGHETDSLLEVATDGTGLRTLVNAHHPNESFGIGAWSSDGKYFVYPVEHGRSSDLWALPMQTSLFRRSREPFQLTNGPLFYSSARPSSDGKHIFAIGTKRRGELLRYDRKSHQLVPFLSGISAVSPTFSKDAGWVAYISYPDHTLWRSRSDGSERRQLTYPPMEVALPFISPDGTKVAFNTSGYEVYVISMQGGVPQKIKSDSSAANFSPDQNLLLLTSLIDGRRPGQGEFLELRIFDLRTGTMTTVPSSQGRLGGVWITQDSIVAANQDTTKLLVFDRKTEKWQELLAGNFVNWAVSPDRKYLMFTTGGLEPRLQRLRFIDRHVEDIAGLKDLRRVVDSVQMSGTQVSVAPDGSPVFTRDVGTQELYSLTLKWP
jgi:DNA-binding winged helix-turn-helix (wHTH) protein/Tol biopolymer transport system component